MDEPSALLRAEQTSTPWCWVWCRNGLQRVWLDDTYESRSRLAILSPCE